jgi:hypothetical protein
MRSADRMLARGRRPVRASILTESRAAAAHSAQWLLYDWTAGQAGDPDDPVVARRRHPPDTTRTLYGDVRVLVRAARERPAMTEV